MYTRSPWQSYKSIGSRTIETVITVDSRVKESKSKSLLNEQQEIKHAFYGPGSSVPSIGSGHFTSDAPVAIPSGLGI